MSVKDFVKQWSDVDGERANYQKDSTFCKVHQHAAGARKILDEQAIGVSRGGKNTKIHVLVTENFQRGFVFPIRLIPS